MSRLISAIIPTYNEEILLPKTLQGLQSLRDEANLEIVVVDAGSQDKTLEIARPYARIISSPLGRAKQNNRGAYESLGDILFFCHAGMQFAPGTLYEIKKQLVEADFDGGGFSNVFSQHNKRIKRLGRWLNIRLRDNDHKGNLIFFGDNGIFVWRRVFEALSGFKDQAIMEDYDFSLRLKKNYKSVRITQPKLILSPHRHERDGFLRTRIRWILVRRLYQLGISPNVLYKLYR